MNSSLWRFLLLGAVMLAALAIEALASPAFAAVDPVDSTDFLVTLVTKFPWLVTLLIVIGALRMVFKPVMLAIEWYVKQTPSEADDVAIMKFQAGPVYKVIAIALDFLASIKLPLVRKPE